MPPCGSCGAPFTWATVRGTGGHMPVDPERVDVHEVAAGHVAVRTRDRLCVVLDADQATRVRGDVGAWSEWSFHRSHWDTCPSSERHRVNPAQEALEL